MKLYDYFRSSAAYRVRIALNLKGLAPERAFVHLRRDAQRDADYLALNPQGLVPVLVTDDGAVLTQSLAIIEYLEETHPSPPLLPRDADGRARVRAHRARDRLRHPSAQQPARAAVPAGTRSASPRSRRTRWYRYWIDVGLEALEIQLSRDAATGRFCHGDAPTLADVCLVPQLANARRVAMDLSPYPTLTRIEAACLALPAFAAAEPSRQPDAEP